MNRDIPKLTWVAVWEGGGSDKSFRTGNVIFPPTFCLMSIMTGPWP